MKRIVRKSIARVMMLALLAGAIAMALPLSADNTM